MPMIVKGRRRYAYVPGSHALSLIRRHFPKVDKVVDAKVDLKIAVTKRDVAIAKRMAQKTCAMAIACQRKLRLTGMLVSLSTAYLIKGKMATRFHVPPHTSREIISFDRGGIFAIGEYGLKRPGPGSTLDAIYSRVRPRYDKSKVNRKRLPYHRTVKVRASIGMGGS